MKVIMPAGDIPINAKVTKVTGELVYSLRDKITVFAADMADRQIITGRDGAVFLVGASSITAIPKSTELIWHATDEEVFELLDARLNDCEK